MRLRLSKAMRSRFSRWNEKGAASRAAAFLGWLLERDPETVAPIAAALMFAPAIMISVMPAPVIVMDGQAERRLIGVVFADMPAIAIAIADDFGRGCGRGRRQRGCADDRRHRAL